MTNDVHRQASGPLCTRPIFFNLFYTPHSHGRTSIAILGRQKANLKPKMTNFWPKKPKRRPQKACFGPCGPVAHFERQRPILCAQNPSLRLQSPILGGQQGVFALHVLCIPPFGAQSTKIQVKVSMHEVNWGTKPLPCVHHAQQYSLQGPKPHGKRLRPNSEIPKPHSEGPKPHSEGPKPNSEGPKPNSEGPKPNSEGPKPNSEGPKPNSEGPEPSFKCPKRILQVQSPNLRVPCPIVRVRGMSRKRACSAICGNLSNGRHRVVLSPEPPGDIGQQGTGLQV